MKLPSGASRSTPDRRHRGSERTPDRGAARASQLRPGRPVLRNPGKCRQDVLHPIGIVGRVERGVEAWQSLVRHRRLPGLEYGEAERPRRRGQRRRRHPGEPRWCGPDWDPLCRPATRSPRPTRLRTIESPFVSDTIAAGHSAASASCSRSRSCPGFLVFSVASRAEVIQ